MDPNRRLKLIVIFFFFLALFQAAYFYPKLPDIVATHYSADGSADNFSSKNAAVAQNILLFAFLASVFYGFGWLIKKVPNKFINIPNKDYWLNRENRPKAMELMEGFGLKMGIITELFSLMLMQQIYILNIEKENLNSTIFWFGLAVYFLVVALMVWYFYQILKHRKISR